MVTFLTPLEKQIIRKGSIGLSFLAEIFTEHSDQASFSPFSRNEISSLVELTVGHLRYYFADVPPQPNSQSIIVPTSLISFS